MIAITQQIKSDVTPEPTNKFIYVLVLTWQALTFQHLSIIHNIFQNIDSYSKEILNETKLLLVIFFIKKIIEVII